MVLINGVKYACDRCIRGHRVSGCRHIDATLKRIKRKGRPTSQCANCRNARSKSATRSCSCNESTVYPKEPRIESLANPQIPATSQSAAQSPDNQLGESNSPKQPGTTTPATLATNATGPSPPQLPPPPPVANNLQTEISIEELNKLRKDPNVTIKLPDGTLLNETDPAPAVKPQPKFISYASHLNASRNHVPDDVSALSNSMPHRYGHLNIITHASEDDRYWQRPFQPLVHPLNGPYNADLYNSSTGNNAASAAINFYGIGTYVPNTGSVAIQPIPFTNELITTNQELVDSLPHIDRKNVGMNYPKPGYEEAEAVNDAYAFAHMQKLSNLY